MPEILTSFAISVAANIACSFATSNIVSVDKEIKGAFEDALKKWAPNASIRDHERVILNRSLKNILENPFGLEQLNPEIKEFIKFFNKSLAKHQVAFNYLSGIKDEKYFKEILNGVENISTKVNDIHDIIYQAKYYPFISWKEFCERKSNQTEFISNNKIEEVKKLLRSESDSIRLLGLSGLGKTRILCEAFKDTTEFPLYYCDCNNSSSIIGATINILNSNNDCTIVLDNCAYALFRQVVSERNEKKHTAKIISIYNDPAETRVSEIFYINIGIKELESVVDNILNSSFKNLKKEDIERIKEFSEGIPLMAILLAKGIGKGLLPGKLEDNDLLNKLLGLNATIPKDEETKIILQSYAIFGYLGYDDDYRSQLKFVATNKAITPLDGNDRVILAKFDSVFSQYHDREIFEKAGNLVSIRPKPLAIWLTEEWFKHCNEERLFETIAAIQELPERDSKMITEAFCKRFDDLNDNDKAQLFIKRLLGPKGPFHNAKVLNTDIGSRLFRSFSNVNPIAVTDTLTHIYNKVEPEILKEEKVGRRNIIWALEKLCFDSRTFVKATKLLAKFAIAENESWANNSTYTFIQLFKILLPGTSANLEDRFSVIEYCMTCGGEYRTLTVKAINAALESQYFSRSGGAEKQGLKTLRDYEPSSEEIREYWEKCVNTLVEISTIDKKYIESCSQVVLSHARGLCRAGAADMFFTLLSHFSIIKNYDWDEMLEILFDIHEYDNKHMSKSQINMLISWEEKLSKKDFYSRFCYVGKYGRRHRHMKWEEAQKEQDEEFSKLADEFVENHLQNTKLLSTLYEREFLFARTFAFRIAQIIENDPVKSKLFIDNSINVLSNTDGSKSGYLIFIHFCISLNNKELLNYILSCLYKNPNLYYLLFPICGATNNTIDESDSLFKLIDEQKVDIIYFRQYLNYSPIQRNVEYIIPFLNKVLGYGEDGAIMLLPYLPHYMDIDAVREDLPAIAIKCIKSITISDKMKYDVDEYFHLVEKLLQDNNTEFALYINNLIIEIAKTERLFSNHRFESVYAILLTKYSESVWPTLSQALLSDKKEYLIYYHLKEILEARIGGGTGLLFYISNDNLFEWCKKNPSIAPERLADMTPIFEQDKFHPIVLHLLDEYGENEHVLSALSSNMGSYSWTGSLIPLLEQEKTCISSLLSHKKIQVREWAEIKIRALISQIEYEERKENHEYLVYKQ